MISQDSPQILNSVFKGVKFFSGDGEFFLFDSSKLLFLEFDKITQSSNLLILIFQESHDEWFRVEKINHMIIVTFQVFKIDGNDSSHVEQFESFLFVGFETIILENIGVDIINDLSRGKQNIDTALHPQGQCIELEIDRIFVIVQPNILNM